MKGQIQTGETYVYRRELFKPGLTAPGLHLFSFRKCAKVRKDFCLKTGLRKMLKDRE